MSQESNFINKIFVSCRHGKGIQLPCNWVVEGRCGADSFPCRFEHYQTKRVRAEKDV
jgi:hypothetical protein